MRVRRRLLNRRTTSNVDVTAFLSLMVILVPFLLISALFSRITILELQGVSDEVGESGSQDPLQLKVVVREHAIEVRYRGRQMALRIPRTGGSELISLSELMMDLKRRHPKSTQATILLEPQIPYGELVQVMDSVRLKQYRRDRTLEKMALFPGISLAETPATSSRGRKLE